MSFLKVNVRQQSEGKPGFMEDEEFEVQIGADKVTLFNKSEDDDSITFVRLTCGATLCVSLPYPDFIKKLQSALKAGAKVVK